ncbi:MAG TPA: hypothetical protein GXX35_11375 [Thermoanaerobacterales bacterium]|nr:hypothetical protein [Thermoanaerobacterales bacterium]
MKRVINENRNSMEINTLNKIIRAIALETDYDNPIEVKVSSLIVRYLQKKREKLYLEGLDRGDKK